MGQLRWNLPSRHTGGGLRILWQWPIGRLACFSGFVDMPRSLKRSPQLHVTHSIDMATKRHGSAEVEFAEWTYRRRVAHSVTVTYRPLCMFLWLFGYAPIVEKVTTVTCNIFNRYGSVAPWVSWGGICRVDIPAAGRAFCDSDLQAVMRVSLPFSICHDRWKGHHNYM